MTNLTPAALAALERNLECDDPAVQVTAARALLQWARDTQTMPPPDPKAVDVGSFDRIAAKLEYALRSVGIETPKPETTGEFIGRTGPDTALAEAGVEESGLESDIDYPDWQSIQ